MTGTATTPARPAAVVIELSVPDDERAETLARSLRTADNEAFLRAVCGQPVRPHHH